MTEKYQNDNWTITGSLGIERAADHLARMCLEVQPPFSIGVTGKWGSGKTSIMRRAFATLGGQPLEQALPLSSAIQEVKPQQWQKLKYDEPDRESDLNFTPDLKKCADNSFYIWYSPWQHQNESNPLIPLLLEIQTQFSAYQKLKKKLNKSNRRGGLATAHLLEHVIDAGASLVAGRNINVAKGLTDSMRDGWKDSEAELLNVSDGQRFHLLFEDAISTLLETISETCKSSRLVIFIDDLDRCEEGTIVTLLESIKLYLGSQRCVFVFGQDSSAVLDAIGRYWPQRSEDNNRDYLEKLFQATLAIPLPQKDKIRTLLSVQLRSHSFHESTQCAKDIELLIEPNPRKIKNFLNSLCANWQLFGGENTFKDMSETRRFIIIHYLRFNHRAVWSIIERQPVTFRYLFKILTRDSTDIQLDTDLLNTEKIAVKEIFSHAFTHVLHDDVSKEDHDKHRNLDLEKAVELFHQRRDRKRSDESFIELLIELFSPNEDLPDHFLYLPSAKKLTNND